MSESLDRPIWHALISRQAEFAEGGPLAWRYAADVSPFAATAGDDPDSLEALGTLIGAEGMTILLQGESCPPVPDTEIVLAASGVQMVARRVEPLASHDGAVELGPDDVADMRELAALTKPGPFLPRTHLLGGFAGIRIGGRLAAMAGERLKLPGFTEVSGICTHPDFRGRGFAGVLSRIVAARIMARGETPFLHAWASNTPAIRLYEALGFQHRRFMAVTALKRA